MIGWLSGALLAGAVALSCPRPAVTRLAALRTATAAGTRRPGASDPAPQRAAAVAGCAALAAGLAASNVSVVLLSMSALGGAVTAVVVRRRSRAASAAAVVASSTELAFALASELRAGRSPAAALVAAAAEAGPLAGPVGDAAALAGQGLPAAPALIRAGWELGSSGLAAVGAVWQLVEQVGAQVADVLERLGTALESEMEVRRELDAALAGPRVTAVLLAALPVAGVALGQSVGARPMQLLVHRPLGWGLLTAATLLDLTGLAIMLRLTKSAVQ